MTFLVSYVTHFHYAAHYARNISCEIHRSLSIMDVKRRLHEVARKRSTCARIHRPETNSIPMVALCDLRPACIASLSSKIRTDFSREFPAIHMNMIIIMENNRSAEMRNY